MKKTFCQNTHRFKGSAELAPSNDLFLEHMLAISLDRSEETRWKPLLKNIEARSVTYKLTRVSAVDGRTLTDIPPKITANTWGCTLSHVAALKIARSNKWPCVLIIEDDIDFVPNFTAELNEVMRYVPRNWNAIWLGGRNAVPMDRVNEKWKKVIASYGGYAYIIRADFYDRLITALLNEGKACDDVYQRLHRHINCYRPSKDLVKHLRGWSDRREHDFS